MITTQAACCLICAKPGVANTVSFAGLTARFSEPVKCACCDAEYHLECASGEIERIDNYESRLRAEAQHRINGDHLSNANAIGGHEPIISVMGFE